MHTVMTKKVVGDNIAFFVRRCFRRTIYGTISVSKYLKTSDQFHGGYLLE
jgi:hypothetical protein